MKLYSVYSKSHEVLKREWFLPSLKDDFDLHVRAIDLPGGEYKTSLFQEVVLEKSQLIIDAIQENWGGTFVYSDVDVQFFKPVKDILYRAIEGYDIVCQRDSPGENGYLCTGFFILKANRKTLRLWRLVQKCVAREGLDQPAFNGILRRLDYLPYRIFYQCPRIKYGYLPDIFSSGGTQTGKEWRPGMDLPLVKDIVLHHANWTVGIHSKIAQLRYVRKVAEGRGEIVSG